MQVSETLSELDLAYVAGLFDGEGYIHFSYKRHCIKRGITTAYYLALGSTQSWIIEFLKTSFGGFTYDYEPGKYNENHKARWRMYIWRVAGRACFRTLRLLEPYLRLKKEHASLLLQHETVIGKSGPRTEDEKAVLRELMVRSKSFVFSNKGHCNPPNIMNEVPQDILVGSARMNPVNLAYVAGLFDGEGHIQFCFRNNYGQRNGQIAQFWICLGSTQRSIVSYLKGLFGGFIYDVEPSKYNPAHATRRHMYTWKVGGRVAFKTLGLLRPYLRIKKPHVDLLVPHEELICKIGARTEAEKQTLRNLTVTSKSYIFSGKGRSTPRHWRTQTRNSDPDVNFVMESVI